MTIPFPEEKQKHRPWDAGYNQMQPARQDKPGNQSFVICHLSVGLATDN
jgi:hypothetical protein